MKHAIKLLGIIICISLCSCGNFLEEYSQNMAYLENVSDLDELLLGECYLPRNRSIVDSANASAGPSSWSTALKTPFFPAIHVMDDDIAEYLYNPDAELTYPRLQLSQMHYWQADPWRDSEYEEITDDNWSGTYRRIAVLNTILGEVDHFYGTEIGIDSTCNRVKGEALFLRAQNYFWLANLYARPYCRATAATDLCVPLKITDPIEDRFFSRSPMEEVYGQIYQDLLDAVNLLRNVESRGVHRASQAAAFALLSRVCLYMERYEEAVAYADSVLQDHSFRLLDFNTRTNHNTSIVYATSPETIFTQGPNGMSVIHTPLERTWPYMSSGYTVSDSLLQCYDDNDLRLQEFFVARRSPASGQRCLKWRNPSSTIDEVSDYMAIRLPEMYLNKAEALALLGRDGEARNTIAELRANRIEGEDNISYSGRELVYFIRDERRRELCFEGHRWFDLRRYAVNTEYPQTKSIEHVSLTYTEGGSPEGIIQGKYVLNPYDQEPAAYILPIPRTEIEFNEGYLSNETRNDRPIITE